MQKLLLGVRAAAKPRNASRDIPFFIYIIRLRTNLGGVFSPWLSGLYRFMCRLVHCSSPYSPKFLKYQLSRFRNEAGFPSQWAGFLIRSGGQKNTIFWRDCLENGKGILGAHVRTSVVHYLEKLETDFTV